MAEDSALIAPEPTKETSDEFADRLMETVCGGYTSIGIDVGSRLGLFELMAGFTEPTSSQEIAAAGGFKERYVREWLGLMAVSKIIEVDQEGRKFFFPPHRHNMLCGPGLLAIAAKGVLHIGGVLSELMECFKIDGPGGIPYSSYPGIHDCMDSFNSDVPGERFTDHVMKIPNIHKILEKGAQVADFGVSSGLTTRQLGMAYPKSVFTGMDFAEEAILKGQKEIQQLGLKNVSLIVQDVCNIPSDWTETWDCVIMKDVAHDVPFTRQLLKEAHRILKRGGLILLIDIDVHSNPAQNIDDPKSRYVYSFSLFHCMPVSLAVEGGEGWGAAYGREKAIELLEKAGFTEVEITHTYDENFCCTGKKQ